MCPSFSCTMHSDIFIVRLRKKGFKLIIHFRVLNYGGTHSCILENFWEDLQSPKAGYLCDPIGALPFRVRFLDWDLSGRTKPALFECSRLKGDRSHIRGWIRQHVVYRKSWSFQHKYIRKKHYYVNFFKFFYEVVLILFCFISVLCILINCIPLSVEVVPLFATTTSIMLGYCPLSWPASHYYLERPTRYSFNSIQSVKKTEKPSPTQRMKYNDLRILSNEKLSNYDLIESAER